MQTHLTDLIKNTPEGQEADAILRNCVHCGFCLATCPTYQLLGNELDSPRGRIYLIKQMLEGQEVTETTQLHLDRCLTCRACETTCPSGVQYGHLLDIGRGMVEQKIRRTPYVTFKRYLLRKLLPNRALFGAFMGIARLGRPLLPAQLQRTIQPQPTTSSHPSAQTHPRSMLILQGCVQPGLTPNTNHATARVLDKLGITVITAERAGCCGALAYHLNAQEEGLNAMRRNIDAWWPFVTRSENPVEAIIVTASGCGVTVKDYGHLLQHDPVYAEKAARIASLTRDISEVITAETATLIPLLQAAATSAQPASPRHLAFHAPCTLQHGMKLTGKIEPILQAAGFHLTKVADPHLCCGSAGTYSILQPKLSRQLRNNKITALTIENPELIVTANIGCQTHLQGGTSLPVRHWIELLDERLN
ncbi:glycolate oxidase subunit GlcF [Nitrosomonas sp.]|uniref:glycolate oxidase subunit GlcF n=1 Tax=Nitrosomonas sp. TaxID=42353 RepID=UPI0025D53EF9|nr:glycolate oxidase subunit GlcF [Nitrosomonas sp.]